VMTPVHHRLGFPSVDPGSGYPEKSGRLTTLGSLENRVMARRGRDRDLKTAGAPPLLSMRTCGVVLRMPCCRIAERGAANHAWSARYAAIVSSIASG
jgi:hypothetical protein